VETIVVGSFTPSVLLDVAGSSGTLADHGLAVTEVPVPSSPAQFRSLLTGELDVALTSPDNVLAYRFSPANPLGELLDARILGAVDRGLGLGLYAAPGRSVDELRGATVGVDVPTSGFALAMYALGDSLGVSRDDYHLVALGSTPKRLAALLAGECVATMLNAGNELAAESAGCRRLAGVGDVVGPYLGTVVAVVGGTHQPAGRRLSDALTATAAAILDGGLTSETTEAAARRLELDDALAARYVERLRDPVEGLVGDGEVDADSLATLVRLRTTYLPVPDGHGGDVLDAALREGSGLVRRH
jgi:ABC-type nitrate/sulfonate/bicarbonate transport system substrate-binding protein